jgi:hypothetical protein
VRVRFPGGEVEWLDVDARQQASEPSERELSCSDSDAHPPIG